MPSESVRRTGGSVDFVDTGGAAKLTTEDETKLNEAHVRAKERIKQERKLRNITLVVLFIILIGALVYFYMFY